MIGERIKQARIAAGLSLRQLSECMDNYVSAQVIHKYELGKAIPGSDVLIHLAQALGVKVEFFFRPETIHVSLSAPAYRKRSALRVKHLQSIQAQVKEKVERYLEMESMFSQERFAKITLPGADERLISNYDDVEKLAVSLRKCWAIGFDPIENLTEVLEDRGLKVVMIEGAGSFDGLSCWANDRIPVVVINDGLPGDRQRSNLAHELGHLIMKASPDIDGEKAAFRFSGAFLVPAEVAYHELGRQRHSLDLLELNMLKKKYGMSMQQWIYRAKDLSIISESRAAGMFRQFRAKNWHRVEPGYTVPAEKPERLKRLVLRAVAERLISPVRAAEFLGQSFNDFRKSLQVDFEKTSLS